MKIKWKLYKIYSRGCKVYKTNFKYKNGYNKYQIRGILRVGNCGRGTSYIIFEKVCLNFTYTKFGFSLSRHFEGHNASHSARAWFRYLCKYPPDYYNYIKEEIKK